MAQLDDLDWEGMGKEVSDAMKSIYGDLFALAYDDASSALPVDVSFELTNPQIRKAISSLAKQIGGVAQTTKDDIAALVRRQSEEGWSTAELAKQIRAQGAITSASRAEMIARTESRQAYNLGSTYAYEEAGVQKVQALDSDNDPECAERDGQIYTLEEARAIQAHPNCVLALSPVVE